jgi:hypothetical protein
MTQMVIRIASLLKMAMKKNWLEWVLTSLPQSRHIQPDYWSQKKNQKRLFSSELSSSRCQQSENTASQRQDRGWDGKYFKRERIRATEHEVPHDVQCSRRDSNRDLPNTSLRRHHYTNPPLHSTRETPASLWAEPRRVKSDQLSTTPRGSGGITPPFLASVMDGGAWSASRPSRFTRPK